VTQVAEKVRGVGSAIADARQRDPTDISPSPEALEQAFLQGLPALERAGPASWNAVAELYADFTSHPSQSKRILGDVFRSHMDSPDAGSHNAAAILQPKAREAYAQAGRQVAEMVAAGADKTGIDLQELSPWEIDRYIQITAQALSILFASRARTYDPHDQWEVRPPNSRD